MFHVTRRLLLRPAWIDDAPVIAAAIGDEAIVRNLARAPWPYGLAQAQEFAALEQDVTIPHFVLQHGAHQIVGSAGLGRHEGEVEIGYWIARKWWGRGFATEAARGVIAIARVLGHRRLVAGHHADNPASGAVLRAVGFKPTGTAGRRYSLARKEHVASVEYELDLDQPPSRQEFRHAA